MRQDYKNLSRYIDGHDLFMTGHQIRKTAGATTHTRRVQNTPAWTQNDKEVRKLLVLAFPKLNEESAEGRRQRISAARWIRVLHLYYRVGLTAGKVAGEMNISLETVKNVCKSICRVYKGLTANNRKRVKSGAGRPKVV